MAEISSFEYQLYSEVTCLNSKTEHSIPDCLHGQGKVITAELAFKLLYTCI